jgi:manganese efflux pump family protein
MVRTLTIAILVLPLAIDTFVLGTALGVAGLPPRERLRTSLVLSAFEAGMPLVGFLVGAGLGGIIGQWSDYLAAVVLAAAGAWMLRPATGEDDEVQSVRLLESARGWTIIVLGLGISLDELAIGFGVGLLRLPLVLLVILIALQAFLAAQLGLRLGSRLAEKTRSAAEKLAGALLLAAAVIVVAEKLLRV